MGATKVFLKNRGVQLHPLHPSNGGPDIILLGGKARQGKAELCMLKLTLCLH